MESTSIKPISKENRIFILDALRGIALLGILLMNIPFFGKSYLVHFNLEVFKEFSGPNYWSWWIVNGFFEGTMRAIFSDSSPARSKLAVIFEMAMSKRRSIAVG
jgi:uncharacterized protein